MKPCLVLMLAAIIPVEARLSYITLRHAAYADAEKGVGTLGHMVSKILVSCRANSRAKSRANKASRL